MELENQSKEDLIVRIKEDLIVRIHALQTYNKKQKLLIYSLRYKLRNNRFRIEKIKKELNLLNSL